MYEHQDKKKVVHNKPFIEIVIVLLLIFSFAKRSELKINHFNAFITRSNCFTGTYLKPSQHLR